MTLADRPLLARLTLKSIQELSDSYLQMQCRYQSAIREVRTKLENLDEEFQLRHKRNPIHHMQSRLKTVQSITEKLQRRNLPVSFASAAENLYDIAGIRVICSYISDIYTIADLLKNQDDIVLIKEQDYITTPKKNGYRSLHLVVQVPVFLAEGKVWVPVEVQIRSIAMDLWASLDHQLRYKEPQRIPRELSAELLRTAKDMAEIDLRMQRIYNMVEKLDNCSVTGS
jgi:putative GTP pyrophosphokinase